MNLHLKFKPITFFIAGLLVGLGILGTSYVVHLADLKQAGIQLSQRVAKYKKLSQQYAADQAKVQELTKQVETEMSKIMTAEQQYQKHFKSFQHLITDVVHVGKQHNLTFLDYHMDPSAEMKDVPGARLFTSSLSLGGSFKDIYNFLEAIKSRPDPTLPMNSIEILALSERNTKIKLTFKYVGELGTFLRQHDAAQHIAPQSFLILDPWVGDV